MKFISKFNNQAREIEATDINYALLYFVDSNVFSTDVFSNDEENEGEIEVDDFGIVIRNGQGNELPFNIMLETQSASGELDGIEFEITKA